MAGAGGVHITVVFEVLGVVRSSIVSTEAVTGAQSAPCTASINATCRSGTARLHKQEEEVTAKLAEWDLHYSDRDKPFTCRGQGCHKRPDFLFFLDQFAVILEVDEDFHRNYVIECEISRIGIVKDILKVPIVLVRFHPESKRYSMLEWFLGNYIPRPLHLQAKLP